MLTPTEMEDRLEKLDRRLDRIEQILPALATKADLNACATKVDLAAFATKEDLKAFATKDDLKAFATKDDLKAFATKDDLAAAFDEVRGNTKVLVDEVRRVGCIRMDAANLGCGNHHDVRLPRGEEVEDRLLI